MQLVSVFPFEFGDMLYYAEHVMDNQNPDATVVTQLLDARKQPGLVLDHLVMPLSLSRKEDGSWTNDHLGRHPHRLLIRSIAFGLEQSLGMQTDRSGIR